ncbi:MAG: type I restriction-modification system subunit M N-terminal domain-containing protein [Chthoniobacteraceae bacterium]
MSNPTALVQKLWNYCNILRDDGLSYGDYVEQLTFLLFLKMADEQAKPPFNKVSAVPTGYDWPSLLAKDGDELESSGARWTADQTHYRHVLETLGKRTGMLGVIFRKAQNKIQDPAKLRRFIVVGDSVSARPNASPASSRNPPILRKSLNGLCATRRRPLPSSA